MQRFKKILITLIFVIAATAAVSVAAWAADTAANTTELYRVIRTNLLAQNETFSVEYTGNPSDLYEKGKLMDEITLIRSATALLPEEGLSDVALLNIEDASMERSGKSMIFHIKYLLDEQKLNYVASQVESIASELQLDGMSDYMKIKTVYQYMGTNFSYDKSLTKFTDYDGLTTGQMVCQGYALLTYKLMHRAGVPCRIVVGVSQGEPHGWNIVKLDGKWYNIDTTWDAADEGANMYWTYFLKSPAEFKNHTRDARYDSNEFYAICPMSETSYDVHSVTIAIDGELFSGLTIRNGKELQLQAVLNPESNSKITWESTDPTVVPVDENGNIQSLTPGAVTITATAEDPTYIPGSFPITAVDLESCSPWAHDELNSYYLRQMYPAALCSDYTDGITREEFALLLSLVAQKTDKGGQYRLPPFEDISKSPYWYNIIYCTGRGIFQGTSSTTFTPEGKVTREQAAKLICSLLGFMHIPVEKGEPLHFADESQISTWARSYVNLATAAGILQGDGTNFDPKGVITREQAGVMLERIYLQYVEPLLNAQKQAA